MDLSTYLLTDMLMYDIHAESSHHIILAEGHRRLVRKEESTCPEQLLIDYS